MNYIYEVNRLQTADFKKISEVDLVLPIALFLKEKLDLKDWDGNGDYWTSPLPIDGKRFFVIRPGHNPFEGAFAISPIELPGLKLLWSGGGDNA